MTQLQRELIAGGLNFGVVLLGVVLFNVVHLPIPRQPLAELVFHLRIYYSTLPFLFLVPFILWGLLCLRVHWCFYIAPILMLGFWVGWSVLTIAPEFF